MDKQKVIEKVRLLFALANGNGNSYESKAALLKAQSLMVEYSINAEDLEQKPESVVKIEVFRSGRMPSWVRPLAKVISTNFRCFAYTVTMAGRSRLIFLGLQNDVELAVEVFRQTCATMERELRLYFESLDPLSRRPMERIKNDWRDGFIEELARKYQEQVQQNDWALAIGLHPLVTAEIAKMNLSYAVPKMYVNGNRDAYNEGMRKGEEHGRSSRMD